MKGDKENTTIGKEFLQSCGDSLLVLDYIGKGYYKGIFQKYSYEIVAQGSNIRRGTVINPLIEQNEFLNKIWVQNCGDSLRILGDSGKKQGTNILFEIEFIKYPYKTLAPKSKIKNGSVLNLRIEEEEFQKKIWKQNCGDSVKILNKTSQQTKEGRYLYEIEYINLPYRELRTKGEIQGGSCLNPRIEEEFMSKIYPQNHGDSVKILKKTDKKDKNGAWLYECTFVEYPKVFYTSSKRDIIGGGVVNYNHPLYSRKAFIKYCEGLSERPSVRNLIEIFHKSRKYIWEKIRVFKVRDYIGNFETEEDVVAEFIRTLYNYNIERDRCVLDGKEIDIYLPDIKVGFEFNGIYWHSDEIFQKRGYKDAEEYHQEKYNLAKEKGIDLYFIKEEDWLNNKEEVKERIKHIIYEHTR